jgi:type II secretory pathway component GspD/PulD (secretin)
LEGRNRVNKKGGSLTVLRKAVIIYGCLVLFLNVARAEGLIEKVDFVDAAVLDVIEVLAKKADLDLVISGDMNFAQSKRTTLHLKNITAEEAIEHVLEANGLAFERKGKVLLVSLAPQAQAHQGEIKAISLKYLSAEKVAALMSKTLPALKTSVGGSANSLVLQGSRTLIEEAKELISSIDNPAPQVLVESKVVEISESDSVRLGVSYGREAGVFRFITSKISGRTTPAEDLLTTLHTLIGSGKAKVVASPRIATLDNHEAIINIGSRIPYAVPVSSGSNSTQWTVEYIDAGVKLKITPRLGEEGYITTSIRPEVSSISEWRTTSAGDFPVISTRNAQATLRVKDGETIAIGGLISESDRENIVRLPILGYLPVVGLFFQNKTRERAKTEIIFLITPHII